MTWKRENGRDGLPIWRGSDAVADPFKDRHKVTFGTAMGLGIGALALAVLLLVGAIAGIAADLWVEISLVAKYPSHLSSETPEMLSHAAQLSAAIVALGLLAWAVKRLAPKIKAPSRFFERAWRLSASRNGLSYWADEFTRGLEASQVGPQIWFAPLDQIARVEVGRTADWQQLRRYPGEALFASPSRGDGLIFSDGSFPLNLTAEYQTFLYLTNGSRRVIYTVNADREGAGMLAQSIREWIEKSRAKAKEVAPAPQMPGAMADERREGFDL